MLRGRWTTITVNAYLHRYQTNFPPKFKRFIHSHKNLLHWAVSIVFHYKKAGICKQRNWKNQSFKSSIDDSLHWHRISDWLCGHAGLFFSVWDVPSKWVSFECRGASSCESEKRRHIQQLFHYSPSEEQLQDLSAHDITTAVCLYSAVRLNERPPHSH